MTRLEELKKKGYFRMNGTERAEYRTLKGEAKFTLTKLTKSDPTIAIIGAGKTKLIEICEQLRSQILDGHARSAVIDIERHTTATDPEIRQLLSNLADDPRIAKDATARNKVLRAMELIF